MPINGISPQFLQATQRPVQSTGLGQQGYHQALGEYNPSIHKAGSDNQYQSLGMPTIDQMERAQAYIDSMGVNGLEGNIFANPRANVNQTDPRGEAFNGFPSIANNGTGELQPVIAGREDAITGLDFRC